MFQSFSDAIFSKSYSEPWLNDLYANLQARAGGVTLSREKISGGGGVARVAVANCDWLASFPLRHLEIATVSPPPLLPPRRRGSKFMWGSTSVIAS